MSSEEIVGVLKNNQELSTVPDNELAWLITEGEIKNYAAGDKLFSQDDPIDRLFIILSGELAFNMVQVDGVRTINEMGTSGIIGALPFSRAEVSKGEAIFQEDSKLLAFSKSKFPDMICQHPKLTEALVHVMTSRVRDFTHSQQQFEKLASLGKLSAGLHHELNNPASAIRRSSEYLKHTLENIANLLPDILQKELALNLKSFGNNKTPANKASISLLEKSEQVDGLANWLEENEIDNASEVAEHLLEMDFTFDKLLSIGKSVRADQLKTYIKFMNYWIGLDHAAADIHISSGKVSELVNAVKSYTHMDRAPSKERAQIMNGIRSSVLLLGHKLRDNKVRVIMPENTLPEVCIYEGELNQVWTNLIDNAIDAIAGSGEIVIEATEKKRMIEIKITDSGQGISEKDRIRIFDPFFTTKKIGEGTGMGLDIVKKIIDRHQGEIAVISEEGKTTFTISIPLEES